MTMTSLQPTVLYHFPMLVDWHSGRVTWADLMFIESEIIIGTMVELMKSYSVPCFSVHDSIIVKKKDQQIAMETLESQFLGRTTIEPRLKVEWYLNDHLNNRDLRVAERWLWLLLWHFLREPEDLQCPSDHQHWAPNIDSNTAPHTQ